MQATKAVDYGFKALLVLASRPRNQRHLLNELAEKADVPRNYLVKILKSLSHAGIVLSFRGVKGGFALAKDPGEISLRNVVEAIDGPVGVLSCLLSTNGCSRHSSCATQEAFRAVRERLVAELDSCSLAELARREAEIRSRKPSRSSPQHDAVADPSSPAGA